MRDHNRKSNGVHMNTDAVLFDAGDVSARLLQLGLNSEVLRESVLQAHLRRTRLTANHPRIFPGLEMWGWAVAALRDQTRPLGCLAVEIANFPLTVNQELAVGISVAAGDEATGFPRLVPSNRARKGRNTAEAVEGNQQLDMFEAMVPRSGEETAGHETWVLLHYTDWPGKEIRIELSRPSEIGRDGKISAWSERIILGSLPLDDEHIDIKHPDGPDIV